MKIRNGFVSNSSSSSFVVLTTVENHNRAMDKLSDYTKAVVNKIMYKKDKQLFGRDMMVGGYLDTHGCSIFDDISVDVNPEDDEDDSMSEAFDYYVSVLGEQPDELFTHYEDG